MDVRPEEKTVHPEGSVPQRNSGGYPALFRPAKRVGDGLLRLVFPPRCAFCGSRGTENVCPACEATLRTLRPPEGEPLRRLQEDWITAAVSVWQYRDLARSALLALKFRKARWRGAELARQLAACAAAASLPTPDVIVPVPDHWRTRLERPYSVPELLAERISRECGVPMDTRVLVKRYRTRPQHRLSRELRRGNPVGAYRIRDPRRLAGRTVWLVDDVITTGFTMRECARMLWLYGAKQVVALSFAVAAGTPDTSGTASGMGANGGSTGAAKVTGTPPTGNPPRTE